MANLLDEESEGGGSTTSFAYKLTQCAKRIKRRAQRHGVFMTWRQARKLAADRVWIA